jgi:hypothetical protein
MFILSPREVKFGAAVWSGIALVAIDRTAAETIEEFGDQGPWAVFADVPRQRVRIHIVQEMVGEEAHAAPAPGDEAVLVISVAPAGRMRSRQISARAVVLSARHEVSLKHGSVRSIVLAAISGTGAADPITVTTI